MKTNRVAHWIAILTVAAIAGHPRMALAQTAGELMQKGIYTQETAGDLDGAIAIYRQIVNSGSSPRDIAAQAQYRLAQSLLQKGDLGNAATEFSNLARNYADYGRLVSNMASMAHNTVAVGGSGGRGGYGRGPIESVQLARDIAQLKASVEAAAADVQAKMDPVKMTQLDQVKAKLAELAAAQQQARRAAEQSGAMPTIDPPEPLPFAGISFEGGSPITMKGTVVEVIMMNPAMGILIDPQDGSSKKYAFQAASPRQMTLQGWTRESVKMGDQVTITGVLANGGQVVRSGVSVASATTIIGVDGRKLFDRALVQK